MSRYANYTDRPFGALMFDELEDYEEFISEMSEVIADPKQAKRGVALHNRALAHWEIGKADLALADFDGAIRLLPGDGMPNHMKAMLLEKLERIDDAILCAEEAVRISPKSPTSRRLLAQMLISVGRLRDALPHYVEAVRIEPSFAQTKKELRDLKARLRSAEPGRPWWKLWD